jgi:hypothetical protein
MLSQDSEEKKEIIKFSLFCIFLCILWCAYYAIRVSPELADPDCYLRLTRVINLYEGGGWYQSTLSRSNAPYGESLHWTRPLDVLLIAGALSATAFVDFRTGLFWWGVLISPVLLVATLIVMLWAARPLLSNQGPFLLGILLFFQMGLMSYCQPGRPDQHSLLIFLFVVMFGFGLRLVSVPASSWFCCAAGIVAGLSMWAGLELILADFLLAAILCLLWIWEKGDFAKKSIYYSICLFIAASVGLLAERPWNNLAALEFDKLSIVHLSMCGLLAGFWIIAGLFSRFSNIFSRRIPRFFYSVAGAALSAIFMLFLFPKINQSISLNFILPKIFGGQVTDVDPRIIKMWYERIGEIHHIFSRGAPITLSVQFAGTIFVSGVFLVYLIRIGGCRNKRGWRYVLVLSLIYVPLAIYRIRWMPYAQILLMLPMAEMMDRALKMTEKQKRGMMRIIKNVSVIAAFSATFLFLGLAASLLTENKVERDSVKNVSLVKICWYLNQDEQWSGRSMRILTNTDFGPEIIYRTRHETIGSPYHRNFRGILDTYDIMTADTDDIAHKLINNRDIRLILLSKEAPEFGGYSKTGFYQRLVNKQCPNWLKPIDLPKELSTSFKLFEVTRSIQSSD